MYVFHRRLFLLHQNWRRGVLLPDSLYTPSRIWSQTSELSAVLGRARLPFLLPKLQRILHFDILKQSLPIRRSKQISASKSCTELRLLSLHSNRGSDISLYLALNLVLLLRVLFCRAGFSPSPRQRSSPRGYCTNGPRKTSLHLQVGVVSESSAYPLVLLIWYRFYFHVKSEVHALAYVMLG